MRCETMRGELVGFHFGALDDAARRGVEAHLLGCGACLGEYLALKRDVETAAEAEERPSASARATLRAAVAREVGTAPRPWRWWERPLAFGLATAAVLLAIVTVQAVRTAPGVAPYGIAAAIDRTQAP